MKIYDIYGIGNALVDTEIEVSDKDLQSLSVEKGVMTLVDQDRQHELIDALEGHLVHSRKASGGSAANSVIAANYFGASSFYGCKVANDELGTFYLNDLKKAGVDFHETNGSASGITGKCLVMITPDAERTMNTFLGISESLSIADINEEALSKSKYAYIEGYLATSATALPAAIKLRELAQSFDTRVAVSLSDPAIAEFFRDGIADIIGEGIDLLFCNEAEALSYTQSDTLESAIAAIKNITRTFAITRGAEGALIYDGEQQIAVPGFKATAVDTNGAGDMFAGAFLYSITRGQSYEQAALLANKASAKVVSQFGPRLRPEQHEEILKN